MIQIKINQMKRCNIYHVYHLHVRLQKSKSLASQQSYPLPFTLIFCLKAETAYELHVQVLQFFPWLFPLVPHLILESGLISTAAQSQVKNDLWKHQ